MSETKKLTLSIDAKSIRKAKKIATLRNKSVSAMVQEFFDNLTEDSFLKKKEAIQRIRSSKFSLPINFDYEKARRKYYTLKHKSKKDD
jgi:hypothetical protein